MEQLEKQWSYDAIVVGAGAAGLTAAAYLCKDGYRVLLCEKEEKTGGLISSFKKDGFHFDGGARAFVNSGIIFPMLDQLGIDMKFVKNKVSIGIENQMLGLDSQDSLWEYEAFLCKIFPENTKDIHAIILEIQNVIKNMDVLYGIDNPLFLDYTEDPKYIFQTLLPWFLKYQINIKKAMKLDQEVNHYLLKFTSNQSLIDMITQHFFERTPTFFALSYFGLYLDYSYPLGGTSMLAEKLSAYIKNHHGDILTQTEISAIDIQKQQIKTSDGKKFGYKQLVWAADMTTLYKIISTDGVSTKDHKRIQLQKDLVQQNKGGNSILTVYLGVNLDKEYFQKHSSEHLFYTPQSRGISSITPTSWDHLTSKSEIKSQVGSYLEKTTFEISFPVLRDETLAPKGKTGVTVSTLMDYKLIKKISDAGWYDEFKEFCTNKIIDILTLSIYKELKENIIFSICATPLTIQRLTGNGDGAITGWAFTDEKMPSETRFKKISKSILTPIPNICQAGQWTFSPSGVPISILTGKLAADEISKRLKK